MSTAFLNSFQVLKNLPRITDIKNDGMNTFLLLCNNITHEQATLAEPSFEPMDTFDNTKYDENHTIRYSQGGEKLIFETDYQKQHYPANAAAFIQLGNWFDYLRENDLYNNTRIILVSDHGSYLGGLFNLQGNGIDVSCCNPLLMVKDFESTEFCIDDTFMTNADTPTISIDGLFDNPENPFTGKILNNNMKYSGIQHVYDTNWNTDENNGFTFMSPIVWTLEGFDMTDLTKWYVEEK